MIRCRYRVHVSFKRFPIIVSSQKTSSTWSKDNSINKNVIHPLALLTNFSNPRGPLARMNDTQIVSRVHIKSTSLLQCVYSAIDCGALASCPRLPDAAIHYLSYLLLHIRWKRHTTLLHFESHHPFRSKNVNVYTCMRNFRNDRVGSASPHPLVAGSVTSSDV